MSAHVAPAAQFEQLQKSADDIDHAIRSLAVRCGLVPHSHTYQPLLGVLAHIEKHVACQRRELVALRTIIANAHLTTADLG